MQGGETMLQVSASYAEEAVPLNHIKTNFKKHILILIFPDMLYFDPIELLNGNLLTPKKTINPLMVLFISDTKSSNNIIWTLLKLFK